MARHRARVDGNQASMVKALRANGAKVIHLHELGHGVPDLLVGFRGRLVLLEVKDPSQPKSAQALTDDEVAFFEEHADLPVFVVLTAAQALEAIGAPPMKEGTQNSRGAR